MTYSYALLDEVVFVTSQLVVQLLCLDFHKMFCLIYPSLIEYRVRIIRRCLSQCFDCNFVPVDVLAGFRFDDS